MTLMSGLSRDPQTSANEEFVAKWAVLHTTTNCVTKSRGRQAFNLYNIADNLGLYQALCEAVVTLPVNLD